MQNVTSKRRRVKRVSIVDISNFRYLRILDLSGNQNVFEIKYDKKYIRYLEKLYLSPKSLICTCALRILHQQIDWDMDPCTINHDSSCYISTLDVDKTGAAANYSYVKNNAGMLWQHFHFL